jgi:hypothetical protein
MIFLWAQEEGIVSSIVVDHSRTKLSHDDVPRVAQNDDFQRLRRCHDDDWCSIFSLLSNRQTDRRIFVVVIVDSDADDGGGR